MNIRLVAVLTAAILLAHAVLIHLFLKTNSLMASVPAEKEKEETEEFQHPVILPEDPMTRAQEKIPEPEPVPEPEIVPRHAGKTLDFSRALRNNPKALPGAKNISAGLLVDLNSGKVLWAKKTSGVYPIASMSKLMTLLLAYEKSRVSGGLDVRIPVTREAANVPPSKVNLMTGETFTLRELMIAASVKSANDATYLIAQHFGNGNVQNFVDEMNRRAVLLGMKNTRFFNPHGLPGKTKQQDNRSTAEDMVRLCEEYMKYPELMKWAGLRSASFREAGHKQYLKLYNHNNLLPGARFGTEGVTGMKTGFTNRAGFCLAASCTRNGRTLLAIVTGASNLRNRDSFVRDLLNWGFKQ